MLSSPEKHSFAGLPSCCEVCWAPINECPILQNTTEVLSTFIISDGQFPPASVSLLSPLSCFPTGGREHGGVSRLIQLWDAR